MILKLCIILILVHLGSCKKPNVVLFLTDDQDILLGGLTPMERTLQLIANEGTVFQNAFVNTPVCCPSRSTMLSGRYQHNTRVFNNSVDGGCCSSHWRNNIEPYSLASVLSEAGYDTFYAGKYLNTYGSKETGGVLHIPPGWNSWFGLVGNSKYYNYTLSENGLAVHYTDVYLTDLIKEKALQFLSEDDLKAPFFMMMGTPAPHAPFTPAPRHRGAFPRVRAARTPAFNYTPTGKHWLVRMSNKSLPTDVSQLDNVQQLRFESLLAVDELVEAVLNKLQSLNELQNTYIIYTSDNGYHIGQFCQAIDKRQPYDTDITVPLLIRGPGIKKKFVSTAPVSTVDVAPTILTFAGVEVPEYMDGESFASELFQHSITDSYEKSVIPVEYHGEGNPKTVDKLCPWHDDPNLLYCSSEYWCKCDDSKNNTYICMRHVTEADSFLYCQFFDSENFREAYNVKMDRYQLENLYKDMSLSEVQHYNDMIRNFSNCSGSSCRFL